MFFCRFQRRSADAVQHVDPKDILGRLFPFAQPDRSGFLELDRAMFVQGMHCNTSFSFLEPTPLHDQESGIVLATWSRIDNRGDLAEKLGLSKATIDQLCDSEVILKCYLKWGEECVDHLIGDFVFVLFDRKNQKIFCGRDHFGVRPFYYYLDDDRFFCATSLNGLMGQADIPVELRRQWMAEYLTNLSKSFDQTPYRGIKKLPPGHCLTVTPELHRLRQYFQLSCEPPLRLKDSRECVDAYREQLEEAVRCRLVSDHPIGSELSGGLDSSTVTAFAAKFLAPDLDRLHTFSFANCELEPEYIGAVIKAWALPHNHTFTAETLTPLGADRALTILGYPVEHGNANSHEPFYQLAEEQNIRTLLSGFGGDEFVTTIHGYLAPLELLMQHRYRDLYHILPGNPMMRLLRVGRRIQQRLATRNFTSQEYNPGFLATYKNRWPHQVVRPDLAEQYDLHQRYLDQARFDAGYTNLKKFTLEKRWHPFIPTRLENCSLMAAARKIEYRWPLLDVRLVNFFLRIPSMENFYRGMGRYLHRRAIAGVVPDLVTWKPGKGMGAPPSLADNENKGPGPQLSSDEMHPGLAEVIDTDKLGRQLAILATGQVKPENRFQIGRNLRAVKRLDHWLKHLPGDFSVI